jgi:hypothetical protein
MRRYSNSSVPFVIFGKKFVFDLFLSFCCCHFTITRGIPAFLVPAYLNSIFCAVMCALHCYYAASSGKWCYSEERTSQLLRGGSLKSRILCIVVPAVLSEDNFNLLSYVHARTIELWILLLFLVAFARLRKATVSLVMSVRPPRTHLFPLGRIFHEIWYVKIFRESVRKVKLSFKSDNNIGYFTWRSTFMIISRWIVLNECFG